MRILLRALAVLALIGVFALPSTVLAQSTSPSYQVDEVFFGSGGELNACSDQYCSKQSAGELTVGSTSSANYAANAGFNTTDEPLLEVAVNGNVSFGELSLNETRFGSANLQVRTYLAKGYMVYLAGTAPKIPSHTLTGMGSGVAPAFSEAGIEQFGLSLGDNPPVQVPHDADNPFSFGTALSPYNQAAAYAWAESADELRPIAQSTRSSGQTNYTMTMMANMSVLTPAGRYTTSLSVVVVPEF